MTNSGPGADDPLTRSATWRLVHVLEALAAAEEGLGVREASRQTGIDKSSVSRLLAQLVDLGMVTQEQASGRYLVGPRLYAFGAALVARDSLTRAARPILERLAAAFDETCYLAVREPSGFAFRAKVDCTRPIRYMIELGHVAPLHAGAAGRAILAGLTDDEVDEALGGGPLERLTDATVTDRRALRALAEADRRRGYAVSRGERVRGGTAVAAPFFDASALCRGSIVFTRPAERHRDDDIPEKGAAVVRAASELSSRLGHALPSGSPAPGKPALRSPAQT